MSLQETSTELWGGETTKAVANFPISGERVPVSVVRWLGRIKGAAARVNAELGLLDSELAERIAQAGDAVANGDHDDQFPIDVFQTGSGTSSNMNANEVLANLAGEGAHPNDHVNMGQSSNDVFPSAVHLAALDTATNDLLPGELGDHLVGVHVRGGAGAGLEDVDRELVVVLAGGDLVAGLGDRVGNPLVEPGDLGVGPGRSGLDPAEPANHRYGDLVPRDREVVYRFVSFRAPELVSHRSAAGYPDFRPAASPAA